MASGKVYNGAHQEAIQLTYPMYVDFHIALVHNKYKSNANANRQESLVMTTETSYHVDYSTSSPLAYYGAYEHLITEIKGNIVNNIEEDISEIVGEIKATKIELFIARVLGFSLFNLLDLDSEYMDLAGNVVGSGFEEVLLPNGYAPICPILLVNHCIVSNEHKGRMVGLKAIADVSLRFGPSDGFVVLKTMPLQLTNAFEDLLIRYGRIDLSLDPKKTKSKLTRYYKKAGFMKMRNSYMYLYDHRRCFETMTLDTY